MPAKGRFPIKVISSENGLEATRRTYELVLAGRDPLDACIAGVGIVEDDPNDMSVGYGGLPNEEGIVELDAAVMHGPTHRAGAVAALRNIKNPAQVAKLVMDQTDHVLLVGEGALSSPAPGLQGAGPAYGKGARFGSIGSSISRTRTIGCRRPTRISIPTYGRISNGRPEQFTARP